MEDKILTVFANAQCYLASTGVFVLDEEAYLISYKGLENETKETREHLKPYVHELRNKGLIYLAQAVDADGIPNGSAWSLTEKGRMYCYENKLSDELLTTP
jgi:hypothetical protein